MRRPPPPDPDCPSPATKKTQKYPLLAELRVREREREREREKISPAGCCEGHHRQTQTVPHLLLSPSPHSVTPRLLLELDRQDSGSGKFRRSEFDSQSLRSSFFFFFSSLILFLSTSLLDYLLLC